VSDGFVLLLADDVRIKEELELLQHAVSAIVRGLQKVKKYRLDGPQRPVDHRLIESVRHLEGCKVSVRRVAKYSSREICVRTRLWMFASCSCCKRWVVC
jgi:hypothetical protein